MLARTAVPLSLSPAPAPADPRHERGARRATLRVVGREVRTVSPGPPSPEARLVCTNDARCLCPLSGHVTDAERAVMNDIARQAARLATVLAWIFALIGLAALVLLARG